MNDDIIRILAVDSDATFLDSLAQALLPRGLDVVPLTDVDEALETLRLEPDSFDVLALAHTHARAGIAGAHAVAADLPIVLLSDSAGALSSVVAARQLGALYVLDRAIGAGDLAALTLRAAATCARLARETRLLKQMVALTTPCDRSAPGEVGSLDNDLAWADTFPYGRARELVIQAFERRYVARLLRRARGNLAQASRLARLDRSNLRRILMRHGVRVEDTRAFSTPHSERNGDTP